MAQDAFGNETTAQTTITPTATPVEREPRRPSEGLLLGVWALVTLVAVVLVLMRQEDKAVNDPVQKAARGEVAGLAPLSLMTADRLRQAMAKLHDRAPGGRIINLRVAPTRVDAELALPGYKAARYQVDTGLGVSQSGTGETTEKGLRFSAVDPAAPQRILRKVNAKSGTKPGDVDYAVLIADSTAPRDSDWSLFLARGTRPDRRSYIADLHGRDVRGNW